MICVVHPGKTPGIYSFTAEWTGVMVFDVVHSTLSGEKWHNTFLPLVGFEPTTSSVVAQTANHTHTHTHTYIHTHTHTHTHTHRVQPTTKNNPGMVKCLELSPIDQNLILIGYEKGVIVLWDLDRCLPSKNYPASIQDCQQVSEVSESMHVNVYRFKCLL